MGDGLSHLDFGDSDKAFSFIQEKYDDIEKALIPQMNEVGLYRHGELVDSFEAGMILHLVGGTNRYVSPEVAELILNDGILNRLRIKIELYRG